MTDKKPGPHYKTKKPAEKLTTATHHRKAAPKLDVTPPGRTLPSASARPIITATTPQQADTTLTVLPHPEDDKPLIHKRIMIEGPSTAQSSSEQAQSAGFETPAPGLTAPQVDNSTVSIKGSLKVSGRPAKPLMTEPVAAGPTIEELIKAKQQSHEAAKAAKQAEADKPVGPTETVEPTEPAKAIEPAEAAPQSKAKPAVEPAKATAAAPSESKKLEPATMADSKADSKVESASAAAEKTPKPDDVANSLGSKVEAPAVEPERPKPVLYGGKSVLVINEPHGVRSFFAGLLLVVVILLVIVTTLNFLLDAEIITITTSFDIPHTNML